MSRIALLGATLFALATLSCVAAPAHRAISTEPADPDAAVLGNDCLSCHSGDLIRQQRLSDKQWAKSVEKMRTWGAPTEPEEVAPLLSHLTTARPDAAEAFVPQTLSVTQVASLFQRPSDGALAGGDAGRGRNLYVDRCEPCHGADALGGALGVALAGRHVLDRARDVAAVVRAGRGRMPGLEETTDTEVADLLAHLRSLRAR